MNAPRAVVLLSGGLDSATLLAIARSEGLGVLALSFDYGQRHADELDAARRCATAAGAVEHLVLSLDLRAIGGSALTAEIGVPKDRAGLFDPAKREVPVTYVPARNTIFLAVALALAEARGASDIYIGVNVLDTSGYPDCRPEFIAAFESLAAVATRIGTEGVSPRIRAPLLRMTKAQIIRRGLELGVDYGLTRSCYDPDPAGRACGHCDSCRLRLAAFGEVGVPDPAPYR
ncbi:MAG: 7-cyano-7-deazaguanine synthase QueC [Phycisphaerales bacterium]|nr:7-cyano-7-deazaguanine synthase QueC [Phycisphaerales bacterium]